MYVSRQNDGHAIQAQLRLERGGRQEHLGYFATAEEALAVARARGPAGAAAPPGRKRPAASGAGPPRR